MRGQPKLIKLTDRSGKLKSDNWYIVYCEGKRNKRVSTGYRVGTQDHEAQLALAHFVLNRNTPVAREPGQLLIAQALKDYWDEHLQYGDDPGNYRYVDKCAKDTFGHLFVSQFIQAKADAYTRKCQTEGLSNGTIRKILAYICAATNHAVKNERITHAPRIKLPPPPAPRERILSEEEIFSLLNHCKSDHVRHTIVLMLNTGQRPGAIAKLTWFQVDLKERVIHFERTTKRQTNKRVRPVVMNQETYDLLIELHAQRRTEYVIEYTIKNKKGEVLNARPAGCIKRAFDRACIAAGFNVKGVRSVARVSLYTLRHTFANIIATDDKTRSDIMGHTSTKTTQHHYLKTNKEKQRVALDSLPKLRKNYAKPESQILSELL